MKKIVRRFQKSNPKCYDVSLIAKPTITHHRGGMYKVLREAIRTRDESLISYLFARNPSLKSITYSVGLEDLDVCALTQPLVDRKMRPTTFDERRRLFQFLHAQGARICSGDTLATALCSNCDEWQCAQHNVLNCVDSIDPEKVAVLIKYNAICFYDPKEKESSYHYTWNQWIRTAIDFEHCDSPFETYGLPLLLESVIQHVEEQCIVVAATYYESEKFKLFLERTLALFSEPQLLQLTAADAVSKMKNGIRSRTRYSRDDNATQNIHCLVNLAKQARATIAKRDAELHVKCALAENNQD